MKEDVRPRRFALLMAMHDSDYVKKMYGGYYNVFVEAYGEEGEIWDMYRVIDGEFPKMEELDFYDGFIVTGSPYDSYGNEPWVLKLGLLLQTLDTMRKRVLGICFGHQVICHALGGKVEKARKGWDIGVTKVELVKDIPPCRFMDCLKETPPYASILQIHQDEVLKVPPGAEVLAFSERTGVEMFVLEDHILGIQGHPEYSKDILCSIIDRLVKNNTLQSDFAEEINVRMEAVEPERLFWQNICKTFLKGR